MNHAYSTASASRDGGWRRQWHSIETGTTVVKSPQRAVTLKKPRKRKKSKSSDGQSNSAVTASDGDNKEKQEANNRRERIVWTHKLHAKFVKACNELGIEDAVPMKILQRMKTTGITRAQIASHLQKYRESLSKRKDEAISESNEIALHHKPPAPAAPPVPPSPQSPLEETPDMRSQPQLGHVQPLQKPPTNGHSSNHAVAENLLYQELHLLLVQPPVQQCFAPPPNQIDPVARRELIMEKQPPAAMMQHHTAAASQQSPMPVSVEQAAGAPVPASGELNHRLEPHVLLLPSQAMNMLGGECSVPEANMRIHEESERRTAQLLVGAEAEKGQGRAAQPEVAVAIALSPPVSIIEQYWRIHDCPHSWDLFGRPTKHGCSTDGDFQT